VVGFVIPSATTVLIVTLGHEGVLLVTVTGVSHAQQPFSHLLCVPIRVLIILDSSTRAV
jgi:hypothetical protein